MDDLGELTKEVVLPPAHHLDLDPMMDETDVALVSASVAETREQLLALISYVRHPALVEADSPATVLIPSPRGRRAPPALLKRRSALDRLAHHEPGDVVPAAFVRHPVPWWEEDMREPLRRELLCRYAEVRTFVELKCAQLTRQVCCASCHRHATATPPYVMLASPQPSPQPTLAPPLAPTLSPRPSPSPQCILHLRITSRQFDTSHQSNAESAAEPVSPPPVASQLQMDEEALMLRQWELRQEAVYAREARAVCMVHAWRIHGACMVRPCRR